MYFPNIKQGFILALAHSRLMMAGGEWLVTLYLDSQSVDAL